MDTGEAAPVVIVADDHQAAVESEAVPVATAGETASRDPDRRRLEMGATSFLLAGVGTAGVLGVSAFVGDPLSTDVVLRLALAGGKAFEGTLPTAWAGGRLDTCYLVTGNYAAGQGLSFGLCGGADIGVTLLGSDNGRPGQTLPFVAVGPTLEIGAELGSAATLLLRAGVGLSLARDTFVDGSGDRIDPSPGTERAEVGLSWKFR